MAGSGVDIKLACLVANRVAKVLSVSWKESFGSIIRVQLSLGKQLGF